MNNGMKVGGGLTIAGLVITAAIAFMNLNVNDAGYRTVVQYPNGSLETKFEPGWYISWFGKTTVYPNVITVDYDDDNTNDGSASIAQLGMQVRYQDGGTGTVYGKGRFTLPNDPATMISLHKDFRGPIGLADKLILPVVREGHNLTAGLMTSEEAYAEKRGTYIQWAQDQISLGKYETRLQRKAVEKDLEGNDVYKMVPTIVTDKDGSAKRSSSDLATYGIKLSGSQITSWTFEKKTLDQIDKKREATMAIITSRANAERAKQDAITAEQQGLANVMTAKYEKEVEKARAVVDAERAAEVAVISAKQLVEVAEQKKLEKEQDKLAAKEEKLAAIERATGEAESRRLVLEADGYKSRLIDAEIEINRMYAQAIAQSKWVPDIQMGANEAGNGVNNAMQMVDLLTAKTAKDLRSIVAK